MPVAGQDGVDELLMIAWRFEEKIFQAATDQVLYNASLLRFLCGSGHTSQ